jgi:hypothetical protein
MKIDMPNENTISKEIDIIVSKGLEPKESFYSYLKNMYRQIGIKYLFRDGLEIIFVILLVFSIFSFTIIEENIYTVQKIEGIYAYLFIISPILFLIMSILHFVDVKQNKTYEIEMACKYNIYQISAFRMFSFSIICILFNFVFVYMLTYKYTNVNFFRAFMISIASLFIFSVVFLFAMMKLKSKLTKYFMVIGWIVVNLALCIFGINFYTKLLNNISIYTWCAVTIASIFIYIINLKKFISFSNLEEVI